MQDRATQYARDVLAGRITAGTGKSNLQTALRRYRKIKGGAI